MTRNYRDLPDSKMVVPLTTWIYLTFLKIQYSIVRRPDGTFDRSLAELIDRKTPSNVYPVDGVFSFDVILNYITHLSCRVYRATPVDAMLGYPNPYTPLGNQIVPVIVFFHGGSFVHSSTNSCNYDLFCRNLVQFCNVVVVSVNYRRAPEHRWPCAYEDGFTALQWVRSLSWLRSGPDSKVHVYLMGDSSGGNIAHHVAVRAARSEIQLAGNILVNAMFGGMERTEAETIFNGKYFVTIVDRDWYWRAFLPIGADRDHLACNPFGPNRINLKGLKFPRSLVVVAELDLLSDWQLRYCEGLMNAEKVVQLVFMERATVGFYLVPNNNHFFNLMATINNFLRS